MTTASIFTAAKKSPLRFLQHELLDFFLGDILRTRIERKLKWVNNWFLKFALFLFLSFKFYSILSSYHLPSCHAATSTLLSNLTHSTSRAQKEGILCQCILLF
jgi:hypothetical protein